MSEGQTALLLFRLPQSSQRLDLGALSIGIAAGCGCKMKQMRQETRSTPTEWCCCGAKTWGFKTKSANPQHPLCMMQKQPTDSYESRVQRQVGKWNVPTVSVVMMMGTRIK